MTYMRQNPEGSRRPKRPTASDFTHPAAVVFGRRCDSEGTILRGRTRRGRLRDRGRIRAGSACAACFAAAALSCALLLRGRRGAHLSEAPLAIRTGADAAGSRGRGPTVQKMETAELGGRNGTAAVMAENLAGAMRSPPAWPQLDFSLYSAIAHGEVIGPDIRDYVNPEGVRPTATVVTGYYYMPSKQSWQTYEARFAKVLCKADPMVVFVEPGGHFYDVVVKNRIHAPTLVVAVPYKDLPASTTFGAGFWAEQFAMDHEKQYHKSPEIYKMWHMKMLFISDVSELNPFGTKHVFWLDAGFLRDKNSRCDNSFVQVDITEAGVDPSKMLMFAIFDDPGYRKCAPGDYYFVGGGFVGGTAAAIRGFGAAYWEAFWEMTARGCYIGIDQFVMSDACRRRPGTCHLYRTGGEKQWFAAGVVMGNPGTKFGTTAALSPMIDPDEVVDKPPLGVINSNKPPYLTAI